MTAVKTRAYDRDWFDIVNTLEGFGVPNQELWAESHRYIEMADLARQFVVQSYRDPTFRQFLWFVPEKIIVRASFDYGKIPGWFEYCQFIRDLTNVPHIGPNPQDPDNAEGDGLDHRHENLMMSTLAEPPDPRTEDDCK